MAKRRRRALTEAEREAKRAAEREKMEAAVVALQSSEGWKCWLGVRHHFHRYSFRNQLLIALQCPHATRVAGFRRWLELGYAVRKGERAIKVWAPCPPSKEKLRRWREEGEDRVREPRTFFRFVSVFDRGQVEPLPEFPGTRVELDPPIQPIEGEGLAHLFEPLADFAASLGYPVSVEEIPGSARGYLSPDPKKIVVEALSTDFSPNAQVKTELHELGHALIRADRQESDPKLSYDDEEVIVECVAYTVCSSLGLDTSGYSVTYVASWSEGGEIERYAALIDRLAKRLEDVALAAAPEPAVEAAELVAPVVAV